MTAVLIRNATIVDGTVPPYVSDVAVTGDIISRVAPRIGETGFDRVIDAEGLILSPGFIDMHSHSDTHLAGIGYAFNKISQGITSELTGHCGLGAFPVEDFQNRMQEKGLYSNVLNITPHGPLRDFVTGKKYEPMSAGQMEKAKGLLQKEMDAGSFGLSTGLVYNPGISSSTQELVELCSVLREYGGIYFTHMRSERDDILDALDEAILIGREAGVQVHISHLKIMGAENYDKIGPLLAKIDAARAEGIRIWADQYPYDASLTSLDVMLPDDVYKDMAKLHIRENESRILDWIKGRIAARISSDRIRLVDMVKYESLNGLTLTEIAAHFTVSPERAVLRILQDEERGAGLISAAMSESNIREIMKRNDVAFGTDGTSYDAELAAAHTPHPREYGTFPRVLGHYVRDEGVLTLASAVYKMAALPAHILSLPRQGAIKEGYYADLVLFDKGRISDRATYKAPKEYSAGISYVFINGVLAVDGGLPTESRCGRLIRLSA